ncbi:MAG: Ldh family oxidoreductase [Chloroflexi bacterium]|nr:Ldh family oxidoreductase [Chloroflexota bacterium]
MLRLSEANACALCDTALLGKGLSGPDAATCRDAIVFASLRGLDSHGIVSILPGITNSIAQGRIDPSATVRRVGSNVLQGQGTAGPVIGAATMRRAIEDAARRGVGVAVAFNCNHFGAASFYASMALERGLIGVCLCNAGPSVAPFGGARPLHGTNPIAYALPGGDEPPIVLDIATSVAAHGQVHKAARRGQSIPPGWAVDENGEPTTDPNRAKTLLPFGGHKGYGLGVLVDVLTAGLAASTIGVEVRQQDKDREHAGQSFFMLAIDPEFLGGRAELRSRVDALWRQVREIPPARGFSEVLMPGELEHREEARRRRDGIPLYDEDWTALIQGLARAGLSGEELAERFAPIAS